MAAVATDLQFLVSRASVGMAGGELATLQIMK